MRTTTTKLTTLFTLLLLLLGGPSQSFACDRSSIELDSLVAEEDGSYTIYIEQNIGGGLVGVTRGADASTTTFAYGFYGSASMRVNTFTGSVTSDATQTTNIGTNAGAALGAQQVIGYISPGAPYTCVSSTAQCGLPHTDEKQMVFNLSEMPDSIRLLGVEGNGIPFAGCQDDEMFLNLTTLPVVWNGFFGRSLAQEVELNWSTSQEINADYFSVMRSTDGVNFTEITSVEAVGNASNKNDYQVMDPFPVEGTSFYKVVQYDTDGRSSSTEVINIEFTLEAELAWTSISPNPVQGMTGVGFMAPEAATFQLEVFDLKGQLIQQDQIVASAGNNVHELDLSQVAGGMYIIRLTNGSGRLDKKILKL